MRGTNHEEDFIFSYRCPADRIQSDYPLLVNPPQRLDRDQSVDLCPLTELFRTARLPAPRVFSSTRPF